MKKIYIIMLIQCSFLYGQNKLILLAESLQMLARQVPTAKPSDTSLSQQLPVLLFQAISNTKPWANDSTAIAIALIKEAKLSSIFDAQQDGETMLTLALKNSDTSVAQAILAQNANPNTANKEGETPLLLAVNKGVPELVTVLLKKGATIDQASLFKAISKTKFLDDDSITIAIALIQAAKPSFIFDVQQDGETMLTWALKNNSSQKVILELIAQGADPNTANKEGETPLLLAVNKVVPELVTELLKKGATIDQASLFKAISKAKLLAKNSIDIAIALIQATRSSFIFDAQQDGETMLTLALKNSDTSVAQAILAQNANPNTANTQGETPLLLAVNKVVPELVTVLLKKGATIDQASLFKAISKAKPSADNDSTTIAIALIKEAKLSSIFDAQQDGETMLTLALKNSDTSVAQAILAQNANPKTANKEGETPLAIAALKKNVTLTNMILQALAKTP